MGAWDILEHVGTVCGQDFKFGLVREDVDVIAFSFITSGRSWEPLAGSDMAVCGFEGW